MINVTRNFDMTFKPIPRRSHVLPHTVAYLGGANDVLQPTFALLKDNVQIVIEGPPLDPEATTLPSVWDDTTKTDAEYYRYLAIIVRHWSFAPAFVATLIMRHLGGSSFYH